MSEPTLGDREDKITQTQLALARIEGMLTATLARHDQRLDQHENTLSQHDIRLNEKGKLLARHDERISDLEEDKQATRANVFAVLGLVVAALSFIYNYTV